MYHHSIAYFLAIILVVSILVIVPGCERGLMHAEQTPFEGDAPVEATVFAPGVVSDSTSMEFGISFTPDMRNVYFTSQKPGDDAFFIYEARYEDGEWVGPVVAPFSGAFFDADPFVTHDGSGLLFFSMRPVAGKQSNGIPDIWYVERDGDGWGEPANMGYPVNLPESGEGFVTVTHQGTLYFSAMNRHDATGNHDVYKARWSDGAHRTPEYLDLSIYAEFSNPFIAPDESYLIIDSKQEGGYGGADLYIVFREGDSWSAPQNLGPLVNTAGEEGTPALSPDGTRLFFSRDGDIYYMSTEALDVLQGSPN